MLAKSTLNGIESLISQALIDLENSHEEFVTILNENEKYEKMKENLRTMKTSEELTKEEGKKNYNNKTISENKRNA